MNSLKTSTVAAFAAAPLLLSAGCQDNNPDPFTTESGQRQELIADAAQASYPGDTDAEQTDVIAIVREGQLKLANETQETYRNIQVWINGNYVRTIRTLPAGGQVPIPLSSFYDRSGVKLTQFDVSVGKVQFVTGDTLFNTLGPIPG